MVNGALNDGVAALPPAKAEDVPVFTSFAEVADEGRYVPLPDDWLIGTSDVVQSTQAIAAGRYKTVNMAGAAVIAAVANGLEGRDFLFVFGGDGASFAVPPEDRAVAEAALAATAAWVADELQLTLRIAMASVATIRAGGFDVRVARFAASSDVTYAMFSGGGLAWLGEGMKRGDFALAAAPAGTKPDLSGLSCRFEEAPARRGLILSLIVTPGDGVDAAAFREVIQEVLRTIETSPQSARPIRDGGPPLGWPPPGLDLEARASRPAGGSLVLSRLRVLGRSLLALLVFKSGWRLGAFRPRRYLRQLVANSDYRKFDDGLRMTLDCSLDLADTLETRLIAAREAGLARFGLHRQAGSVLTCITPSIYAADHVHFVDGAAGGYAAAALALKQASA